MARHHAGTPASRTDAAHTAPDDRIRKNMDMDAAKLEEARRILGARTDTETVDRALDYVIFQDEVFGALDALAALGGLDDIDASQPARRVSERRHTR